MPEYEVSKLANVLFTKELARGRAGHDVRSYALHPGMVASDAWREVPWPARSIMKLFMLTNEEGAKTTLHCAASEEAGNEDGLFYDKEKPREPNQARERRGARARALGEERRMDTCSRNRHRNRRSAIGRLAAR